jgi:predicted O-methyltransferase YrrM
MNIVNTEIEKYLTGLNMVDEPVLKEMQEFGDSKSFPYVGPLVGRLLMQYAKTTGAKRILELGSGFGYSAAWLFLGTMTQGRIICTEFSEDNIAKGREYLARLGAAGCVTFKQGEALEVLDGLDGEFDIIFNDIDKKAYPDAFKKSLPRLKKGGLFISDNVLWKGRVTGDEPDDTTKAVLEHNRLIFNTPQVHSTIIPLRDGVSVSRKE